MSPYYGPERRMADAPSREEHDDLKERVRVMESKLDRMMWMLVATLAATITDLAVKLGTVQVVR